MLTNPKNTSIRKEYRVRDRFATLKKQKTKKLNSFFNNRPWLKACPNTVRQGAVKQAIENLKSCYSNLKAKNITHFSAPFKTKKKERLRGWSISVEKRYIQKEGDKLFIAKRDLGEMRYYGTKQLHKLMPGNKPGLDCRIQKTAFGEYFLLLPYVIAPKTPPIISNNPVSVDPGVRKFLTTYAPNSQESFLIGNRWTNKVMGNLLELDSLLSNRKDNIEKIQRLRKRIFYLKQEMRNQCANFLSKRYDLVLMPHLDTKKLTMKTSRRLRTKTARAMLSAGHGGFFKFLKEKCWENGAQFMEVREDYTSQTCPCCGALSKCGEVYNCKNCGFSHDRDIVGALNILLKAVRTPGQ